MAQYVDRYGIQFILASIAINALIGIVAIVSGDFSDLDGKILVTSLSVTGASVLALANMTTRERGDIRYVPEAGAAASVIGFALLIAGVWGDFSENNLWKSAVTGILIGAGTAHGALLSLSKLKSEYMFALYAAWGLAATLIVLLLLMLWNSDVTDSSAFLQAVGVVGVLLAAMTIAVPVLHRASRGERSGVDSTGAGEWRTGHCPNCGSADIRAASGGYRCGNCGAVFEVRFSASS